MAIWQYKVIQLFNFGQGPTTIVEDGNPTSSVPWHLLRGPKFMGVEFTILPPELIQLFNELGQQGWELIPLEAGQYSGYSYAFKRLMS